VVVAATSKPALLRVVDGQRRFVPLEGIRVLGVPATGDPAIERERRRYLRSCVYGPVVAFLLLVGVLTFGFWML